MEYNNQITKNNFLKVGFESNNSEENYDTENEGGKNADKNAVKLLNSLKK